MLQEQDNIQVDFQDEIQPEGRGTPQPSIQQEHPSEDGALPGSGVEPDQSPNTLTVSGFCQHFSSNMLQDLHNIQVDNDVTSIGREASFFSHPT